MTAADPALIPPMDLPDDSDLLLDRPEYWIVNKDVCSNPDVADELSFHLTEEGMRLFLIFYTMKLFPAFTVPSKLQLCSI